MRRREETKRKIIELAQGRCEYCRSPLRFSPASFSIEHIRPRSRGGRDRRDNWALACQLCNNLKFIRVEAHDPVSGQLVPLYHPRKHVWREHFEWNHDFTLILGISPIGRATVEKLQLNREHVVNLRRVLILIGEHPPHDEV